MFYSDKIIVKGNLKFNPMHGLETPEESSLGIEPVKNHEVSSGSRLPFGHTYADGQEGIVKTHALGTTTEPMAYHLGKSLGVPVPKTVVRQFPSGSSGTLRTHSVQQRIPGAPLADLSEGQKSQAKSHPDFHKMAMFDWLTGNEDRHDENSLYENPSATHPTGRVHAIDNGEAFVYHKMFPQWKQNPQGQITMPGDNSWTDGNIRDSAQYPIPEDFRQSVLDADPTQHRAIMDRFLSHPNWAKSVAGERRDMKRSGVAPNDFYSTMAAPDIAEDMKNQYEKRLNTLKAHMANPEVRTMGDLHSRLFHKP